MIKKIFISEADKEKLSTVPHDPTIEEEDNFDYSQVIIEKPWGYEYLAFTSSDVAVWLLHIKKGFRTSMHCHPHKKTSLVLLSGEALFSTLNGDTRIAVGDGFLIDRGVFHATEALSSLGITVMETETPTNKKNLIRLHDRYRRENKRYESGELYGRPRNDADFASFHRPAECYDCEKKFGECTLTIIKYQDSDQFQRQFSLANAHSLAVLRGKIFDSQGRCIFEHGDVANVEDLRKMNGLCINDEVDLLLVRKQC